MSSTRSMISNQGTRLLQTVSRRRAMRMGGVAGALAAGGMILPRAVFAQSASTPVATPGVDGVITSSIDGVPDAFTKTPVPFQSVGTIPARETWCAC